MFRNLRISTRLAATLGLLLALLMAVVGIALWQMAAMRAAALDISDNRLPSVERVNRMNTGTSDLRTSEFQHVLNTDADRMVAIEASMTRVLADFDADHQAYQALIDSDEERQLHGAFDADWAQYRRLHDEILALSRRNENDRARALLEGDARVRFERLSATLMKLVALNSAGAQAASRAAEAAYLTARNTMLGAIVLALALAVGAALWLTRSITGPLQQALSAAGQVATGDLSARIEAGSRDETGELLQALDRMRSSLSGVVSDVRANAESVASASAQIAQGNEDLSQRTEEQASALQQTAATMEQISATVRQNADNARHAKELAQGASAVAARGGEVVGKVVTTMQGISESSRRIGDIIGVIDSIAFQTNILALNAAVEAARAGEQGRGFAVVASEVRSLAKRSAEAAREIAGLIGRSVTQVEQGTVLVDEAGRTMGEIVEAIERVSGIVTGISSASAEQSSGIRQVGDAIGQMDHVTQQNAALVEEGSAAAESLEGQARNLVQAVAVFRLAA